MNFFTVDEEKCKRDGICVAECPMKIIVLKDNKSFPTPIKNADKLCINCGHCVAVCPHGAFALDTMKPEQCPPVKEEWLLGPEQVEHFLRARRSIRAYKKKPVDRDTLAKLIDIARYAPTGHNFQPVSWLVVHDSDEVHRMTEMVVDWLRLIIKEQPALAKAMHFQPLVSAWEIGVDVICRGAPHLIIAHGHKQNPASESSCTIAQTYLELAALPLGLGACWCGFFNNAATAWPPLKEALGLPEGHIAFGTMLVGHPKYKYHRLPLRNEARIKWL